MLSEKNLMRIFGSKKKEVQRGRGKLRNIISPNMIKIICKVMEDDFGRI
jgi:hypothetical protein